MTSRSDAATRRSATQPWQTESEIQQAIRLELGRERDLTIWRNNAGVTVASPVRGRKHAVHYGLVRGASDLIGILAPHGRLVALECKSERGTVRAEQLMFLELVRRRGGFAAIVRSVEEARAALERARHGASQ